MDLFEYDKSGKEWVAGLRKQHDASYVVSRSGTMLRMAQLGLRDMETAESEDRIVLGLLALVVFGRSMTFVMQNLRRHDAPAFDAWYAPWAAEMKADPLMRYFLDLRNKFIHSHDAIISVMLSSFGEGVPPPGSVSVEGVPLPELHQGQPLTDKSTLNLARLYVAYMRQVFDSFAPVGFAVQDRITAAASKNGVGLG